MADTPTPDGGKFAELGVTGLRRDRGRVFEEFLRDLSGTKANAIYREMSENDPVIVSALLAIEMYLRRIEWFVEPGDENADNDPRVEFIDSCMDDMEQPWATVVSEALTMLAFGFSLCEVCYKQRVGPDETDPLRKSDFSDDKIAWRKFAPRAQDTIEEWVWDPKTGLLVGAWQRSWPDWQRRFLPADKWVLFRTTHRKDNPQGRALLRGAFVPWFESKRIRELQLVGIERDLTGLPRMYVPPEWITDSGYQTQLDYAERMVTNVRNNEQAGLVLPSIFTDDGKTRVLEFDLIASPGTRQFDLKAEIAWRNLEKLQAMLMDILLLGHEKIGTQALSEDKTDWATKAFEGWLDEIENVLNTHEVPRLLRLNGMPTAQAPKIRHAPVSKVNLVELADTIKKLSESGMELWPDAEFDAFVRKVAGWPELSEEAAALMQDARDRSLEDLANPPQPPVVAPGAVDPNTGKPVPAPKPAAPPVPPSTPKPTPKQVAKYALDAASDPAALDRYLDAAFDEPEA